MAMKASEKIIDALTQLMEGFAELQESIEQDFGLRSTDDEDDGEEDPEEEKAEAEQAIALEMKTSLENVIETEDFAPEEVASLISSLTAALEEIDPNVFAEDQSIDEPDTYEEDDEDEDYEDLDEDELEEDDL